MGDGSSIGGWILTAAIITVLAGGAAAAGGSGSSSGSGGSGASGSSSRTAAGTGTSTGGTPAVRSTTGGGATVQARPCTRVGVIRSSNGARYHQFPVSASGSPLCLLRQGANGAQVRVLQRALSLCSDRPVVVNGVFDARTRTSVVSQQRARPGQLVDGVYGPLTATTVRWPWINTANGTFTGSCARMGDRSN